MLVIESMVCWCLDRVWLINATKEWEEDFVFFKEWKMLGLRGGGRILLFFVYRSGGNWCLLLFSSCPIWMVAAAVSPWYACLVSCSSEFSVRSFVLSLVKVAQLLQVRKSKEPSENDLSTWCCSLPALVLCSQYQTVPAPTDKQGKMEKEVTVLNIDDIFSGPQRFFVCNK